MTGLDMKKKKKKIGTPKTTELGAEAEIEIETGKERGKETETETETETEIIAENSQMTEQEMLTENVIEIEKEIEDLQKKDIIQENHPTSPLLHVSDRPKAVHTAATLPEHLSCRSCPGATDTARAPQIEATVQKRRTLTLAERDMRRRMSSTPAKIGSVYHRLRGWPGRILHRLLLLLLLAMFLARSLLTPHHGTSHQGSQPLVQHTAADIACTHTIQQCLKTAMRVIVVR
eukprot:MONOS_2402.1-p1 / transcript=MONOS_2402.1 / gene=MONOS_2402 / organism=Monocercomonoides_exilis_PA203 / gene_product=unspecified product / transcript_product=unspecified product / location=Mono_scaffold00049:115988-116683(+) / protein_length=232 / sequence_SO=supercontig / SO=protein_coding / is_pseudo=false